MRPFGKRRISNLFVLFGLSVGGANLAFYYEVELAARLYCPQKVSYWLHACMNGVDRKVRACLVSKI